jgi:two-component system response regulator NreC
LNFNANRYLTKTTSASELIQAIHQVIDQSPEGPPILSSDVASILTKTNQSSDHCFDQLTPRELEILIHVAEGQTNREIAKKLVLSVKTVDTHVAKLMKKLQANNRSQLTALAVSEGLL